MAVTGVLSSLCLAATATEVSPVRRLLLVLLFDGTRDAPFRRCDGWSGWAGGERMLVFVSPRSVITFVPIHRAGGGLVLMP